jgi:hypothetical protein
MAPAPQVRGEVRSIDQLLTGRDMTRSEDMS